MKIKTSSIVEENDITIHAFTNHVLKYQWNFLLGSETVYYFQGDYHINMGMKMDYNNSRHIDSMLTTVIWYFNLKCSSLNITKEQFLKIDKLVINYNPQSMTTPVVDMLLKKIRLLS